MTSDLASANGRRAYLRRIARAGAMHEIQVPAAFLARCRAEGLLEDDEPGMVRVTTRGRRLANTWKKRATRAQG